MCLLVTVKVDNIPRKQAEGILVSLKGLDILTVELNKSWHWFRRVPTSFIISEDGDCACSMLTEEADWNNSFWDFKQNVLVPFSDTISALYNKIPEGFSVEALWLGYKPNKEIDISNIEFSEIIKNNKVGTKTKYIVR